MYNIGIILYALAIRIASLFHKKAKLLIRGQHNTWHILKEKVEKDKDYIWIHAASLGEFEQGRPLIEKIKQEYPHYKILLTFFSPSGYEVRKNYPLADIICYLPFDTPFNVTKFFKLIKPRKALFIKYEFWPNYFLQMKIRKIELYSVSSIFRKQQVFFRWYGSLARPILWNVTHFFVQDQTSRQLLQNINIADNKITIVGDTRFDRVEEIMKQAKTLPIIQTFARHHQENNSKMLLIAGSSWPKDEDLLINYFNGHHNMHMIIAPHEIPESHLENIMAKLKRPYIRYSQANEQNVKTSDCLIIDCIGLLSSVYRYGNIAYIGGGFGVGIHNILEAAVYGIPVIWGPNYHKFKEAQDLIAAKGGFSIKSQQELDQLLDHYISTEQSLAKDGALASEFVLSRLGASARVLEDLNL